MTAKAVWKLWTYEAIYFSYSGWIFEFHQFESTSLPINMPSCVMKLDSSLLFINQWQCMRNQLKLKHNHKTSSWMTGCSHKPSTDILGKWWILKLLFSIKLKPLYNVLVSRIYCDYTNNLGSPILIYFTNTSVNFWKHFPWTTITSSQYNSHAF